MNSVPLPPVEHLRDGIWSIPVPIPASSLRYTFVYAFETDKGPYIIDAGWHTEEGYQALEHGLDAMGSSVKDVQGVLVTHLHPDHFGLAGRVREDSGAWIALHPADAAAIHDRYEEPAVLWVRMLALLRRAGVPEEEIEIMRTGQRAGRPRVVPAQPDILINDADRPDVPGWNLLAIWTPGHSPGHLCFYEDRYELMLTGDHVLAEITPSIPLHPQAGENPLGDYLESLVKVKPYKVSEAFPAHKHRFDDLGARVSEIEAHHEHRLKEVVKIIDAGADTAWDLAMKMTWARPWEAVTGNARRGAVLEAMSHLQLLSVRGVVHEQSGPPSLWERMT